MAFAPLWRLAAFCSAGLFASSALAGFTTVMGLTGATGPAGEPTHEAIFEGVYGGAFTLSGNDFIGSGASAGITAVRVDDFGIGGMMNLNGAAGDADDGVWTDGVVTIEAAARYAGFSQSFGFFDGASGGTYQNLFNTSGTGFGITGGTTFAAATWTTGNIWRWGRSGTNGPHSSLAGDNVDGRDHMVAYQILGLGVKTWMLFWEDLNTGQNPDWDYNDLAVELRVVNVIPLPAPLGLAAAGMLGVLGVRRRRPA